MIIDHHNHVWEGVSTGGFLDEGMSVGRILREMDRAGVDIDDIAATGAEGLTMGSALFHGKFQPGTFTENLKNVCDYMAGR